VPNRFSGIHILEEGIHQVSAETYSCSGFDEKKTGSLDQPMPGRKRKLNAEVNCVFPFTYMKIEKLGQIHSDHALREED
jgi:hypothetical protein